MVACQSTIQISAGDSWIAASFPLHRHCSSHVAVWWFFWSESSKVGDHVLVISVEHNVALGWDLKKKLRQMRKSNIYFHSIFTMRKVLSKHLFSYWMKWILLRKFLGHLICIGPVFAMSDWWADFTRFWFLQSIQYERRR